jgi:release factor glutamine methyltransferase
MIPIYEPAEDSYLLQSLISKYVKDKSVLDFGSGSGILAQTCIKSEAKSVLASDINPESIRLLKSRKILAVKSDLFEKIKKKFDLIVFNPPYLPQDDREDKASRLATTGGKKGDEIILRFLKQAKKHLNKRGKILLLLSSLTPRSRINLLLKKLKFENKAVKEKSLFMEKLEVWEIGQS